jgi:hypothetical protein
MKGPGFVLALTALGVLPTVVPSVAFARGAPSALIFSNAYRDTVWFEADTVAVCPYNGIEIGQPARVAQPMGVTPAPEPPQQFFYLTPRTSSVGLVLLVVSKGTGPRLSAKALMERLTSDGLRPHMASILIDSSRALTILEPGCFDDPSMRWRCGWDLRQRVEPLQPIRVTFVVVGRPVGGGEARRGPDGAPAPIREVRGLRPYDLSTAEVSATARVLGDLIVDFDGKKLVPLAVPGTTVLAHAALPW